MVLLGALAGLSAATLPRGVGAEDLELVDRARQALVEGRLDNAIALLEPAAVAAPDSEITLYWLGMSWLASGDFERAETALLTATRLDPYRGSRP